MGNFEQIILLLVSGQGILLSLALISGILKKNYSNFFLGLITAVITLEILNIWGMRVAYHSSENAFPFWLLGSYLIVPAALFLFIKANVKPSFGPKAMNLMLFLPAIIEIGVEFFSFYSNSLSGTNYQLLENPIWYHFTETLPLIAMILILVIFGQEILKWHKSWRINRRNNKSVVIQFSKLVVFFATFSLLSLFWFLIAIANVQLFTVFEIGLLIFLFVFGYIGLFQPSFFNIPNVLKIKTKNEKYDHYDDEEELTRIKILFENEKVYIQQKLSLKDVAVRLDLPTRYVSWLINSYYGTSFISYVNSYRVAEALKRIRDPKEHNKTLFGIALESGFNSKSSFNSIFKASTGKNPSDFL